MLLRADCASAARRLRACWSADSSRAQTQDLRSSAEAEARRASAAVAEAEAAQQEAAELRRQLAAQRARTQGALQGREEAGALHAQLVAAEDARGRLARQVAEHETQVVHAEQAASAAAAETRREAARAQAAEQRAADAAQQAAELRGQLVGANERAPAAERRAEAAERAREEAARAAATAGHEVRTLRARLQHAEGEATRARAATESEREAVASARARADAAETARAEAERAASRERSEAEAARRAAQASQTAAEEAHAEAARLRDELDAARAAARQQHSRAAAAEAGCQRWRDAVAERDADVSLARDAATHAQAGLAECQRALKAEAARRRALEAHWAAAVMPPYHWHDVGADAQQEAGSGALRHAAMAAALSSPSPPHVRVRQHGASADAALHSHSMHSLVWPLSPGAAAASPHIPGAAPRFGSLEPHAQPQRRADAPPPTPARVQDDTLSGAAAARAVRALDFQQDVGAATRATAQQTLLLTVDLDGEGRQATLRMPVDADPAATAMEFCERHGLCATRSTTSGAAEADGSNEIVAALTAYLADELARLRAT